MDKAYTFQAALHEEPDGGAYIIFPYDIRKEFGKGRVKVHAAFNGIPYDGSIVNGTGLLDMTWKERESVWGDDIWVKTEDGLDVIGNQIQVADVTLGEEQKPFGKVVYGRGNNDDGEEGAVNGGVIYTGVLGPLLTKNPHLTAGLVEAAATLAGVEIGRKLAPEDIIIEEKSAEYIKNFMKDKMKSAGASAEAETQVDIQSEEKKNNP